MIEESLDADDGYGSQFCRRRGTSPTPPHPLGPKGSRSVERAVGHPLESADLEPRFQDLRARFMRDSSRFLERRAHFVRDAILGCLSKGEDSTSN